MKAMPDIFMSSSLVQEMYDMLIAQLYVESDRSFISVIGISAKFYNIGYRSVLINI